MFSRFSSKNFRLFLSNSLQSMLLRGRYYLRLKKSTGLVLSGMLLYTLSDFNFTLNSSPLFDKHVLKGYKDMENGEMRTYVYKDNTSSTNSSSVLIIKQNNEYFALSNSCPHFGAPMNEGILIDNIVKCPWHGANFDIKTGICDISPSIDSLEKYIITEKEDHLELLLPKNPKKRSIPEMCKRDVNNKTKFVIIGGGPAALSAAETLRQMKFSGEITMLSEEEYLPYDRTSLTKWIPSNIKDVNLRKEDFLKEYGINISLKSKVISVDSKEKKIILENGKEINYDKLLIASGASPNIPDIVGVKLNGVHTMRTFSDFEKVKNEAKKAKNIVIVGASFIGLECASNLKKNFKQSNITIVDFNEVPMEHILGNKIGTVLKKLHSDNGIGFNLKNGIVEIQGKDNVNGVMLKDGSVIECDMVILGTGVSPRTEMLLSTDVNLEKKFIKCDPYLNTSNEDIYAAGDVCCIPNLKSGERSNFSHYVFAQQQGSIAAMNMLGSKVAFDYIPYFWTRSWDKTLQYTGISEAYDEIFIEGQIEELTFNAYFIKGNKVVGFAAMNSPNACNIVYEAIRAGVMPNANTIKKGKDNLENIKNRLRGIKISCSKVNCLCAKKLS